MRTSRTSFFLAAAMAVSSLHFSLLAQTVTRGPYLQTGTPSSVIVRWRTDVATDSKVQYGNAPGNLTAFASDATQTTEHLITLTGLSPDTTYYYSVGTTTTVLAGDATYFFVTSPATGTAKPTRVWVLGDCGDAGTTGTSANQSAVKNAYFNFTGTRHTDLWLMLGDNAYNSGLDGEFQNAVFNMYPSMLRKSVLWSCVGNHETNQSHATSTNYPYYSIFTFPTAGEAGGMASGTESYYSFNYGNIHFICLDSMTDAYRTDPGPMANWLRSDLSSTSQNWIVAYWHHPPYSKGSHDSDDTVNSFELVGMRQVFLPILEASGVDLVLGGHSHDYERSFLIDGHYGLSGTFTSAMKKDGGDGRPDGNGAYDKATLGAGPHEGVVYTVTGSAGRLGGGALNHPAMFISLNVLGSFVLDVNSNRLDATFVDSTGVTRDNFTILKGANDAQAPSVPANLAVSAKTATTVSLTWSASTDNVGIGGYKVLRNSVQIGSTAGTSYTDTGLSPSTTYSYSVKAQDISGNQSAASSPVSATTDASTANTLTWKGSASAAWSNASNWLSSGSHTVPQSNDTVVFDLNSTSNLATTNDLAGLTGISFIVNNPAGPVSIATNAITLGSGGIDMGNATQNLTISANLTLGAPQTWTVASGCTLTASGTVSNGANTLTVAGAGNTTVTNVIGNGSGGLIKNGAGLLYLTANNSLTGSTIVNGGILRTSGDTGTLTATATLTINAGATFDISGGSGANNPDSLPAGASNTVTLNGGTFSMSTDGLTGGRPEQLGPFIVGAPNSRIIVTAAGASNNCTVTSIASSFTFINGGTLAFTKNDDMVNGSSAMLLLTGGAGNSDVPQATVNGQPAWYDAANGLIAKPPGAATLVLPGAVWKYLDNGSNQGMAWTAPGFIDSPPWASGPAELGYGDGDEATVVSYGPDINNKYITTYFLRSFNIADASIFTSLTLNVLRDDGAVVYLNGAEAFRTNMPTGTITYTTLASTQIGAPQEFTWYGTNVSPTLLLNGTNVLAVEVHQANVTSSDLSFNLTLTGATAAPTVAVTPANQAVCQGSTATFTANPSGGAPPYSYSWTGPGAFAASSQSISVNTAGSYTVVVTDANQRTSVLSSATLTANALPSASIAPGSASVCQGSSATFTASASGGAPSYSFAWSGPNGFAASTSSITVGTAGTYTVVATGANGCSSASASASLSVNAPPSTSVAPASASVCQGNSATFTTSASGGVSPYSFAWSGPNGFVASTSSITVGTAGTYTVVATGANGCNSVSASASLTVNALPSANIAPASSSVCQGNSVTFSASASGGASPYSFAWSGPNGFAASTSSITVGTAGTYTVVATGANGCNSTSASASLTVNAPPSVSIAPASASVCQGNSATFTASASGGATPYSFAWSGPNGFNASTSSITVGTAGTYTVMVTDVNGCVSTLAAATLTVNAPPSVSVTPASASVCQGNSATFTASASEGAAPYSFAWSGPNGFAASTAAITVGTSGTYTVMVTDGNGCVSTLAAATLTVNAPPAVSVAPASASVCQGNSATFTASASGGATPYSLAWSGPNGFAASTSSIIVGTAGTYTVVLTDASGCSSVSTSSALTVNAPPAASVSPGSASVCQGGMATFTASASGGAAPYSFAWSGPNGFAASTAAVTVGTSGTYSVVVTSGNGCSSPSAFAALTVNAPPAVSVSPAAATVCQGGSGAFTASASGGAAPYSFAWSGPNGFSASTPSINVSAAGNYTVAASDQNGCSGSASCALSMTSLSAPSALIASALYKQVNLSWTAPACAASYNVKRSTTSGGPYGLAGTTASASFADTSVVSGTTYYYVVSAVNGAMESFNSSQASATPINGSLSGTGASSSTAVNLTATGTVDWAHWGLSTASSFDHKALGGGKISNYTLLNGGGVTRYANDARAFSWSDGAPAASATNTRTGISVSGVNRGFSITVPADRTARTLKFYVGGKKAAGQLIAHLSDGSAADLTNSSFSSTSSTYDALFTLSFNAASAGQSLTLTWRQTAGTGSIYLQAAAE